MPKLKAILFNDTSQAGHHGCTLVIRQIHTLAQKNGVEICAQYSSLINLGSGHGQEADLLIINGEGSLHHSSKSAFSIARALDWAKDRNIPSYLVNSIYQDNNAQIENSVAKAELVYVRDEKSRQELENKDIDARYVPDLSLSWNAEEIAPNPTSYAITDSTLKGTNQVAFAWSKVNPGTDYLPLLATPSNGNKGFLGNFKRRNRFFFKRHLLSHFSSAFYQARYKNAVPDFDQFIEVLRKQKLIIAGRFHAICLAIDLNIPFCAVSSNSWKVEALLQEAGVSTRLISEKELVQSTATELESRFGHFSPQELQGLKQFKQKAVDGANEMFQEIAKSASAFHKKAQ